jgi:hypothetical protein
LEVDEVGEMTVARRHLTTALGDVGENLGYTVTKYNLTYAVDLILRIADCVEARLR